MLRDILGRLNEEIEDEFVVSIEAKYEDPLLRATAFAYADSLAETPGERAIAYRIRKLNWEGEYTDANKFLEQAKIVGKYNQFNPEVASQLIDLLGRDKEYRLAREGSVAVYVRPVSEKEKEIIEEENDELKIDEIDLIEKDNVLRLWWD